MNEKLEELSKIFKALGDLNRLSILKMLKKDEMCACKILEEFKISQSTLSHHMKILCESKIIKCRKGGKWTYYSLNEEEILQLKDFFVELSK